MSDMKTIDEYINELNELQGVLLNAMQDNDEETSIIYAHKIQTAIYIGWKVLGIPIVDNVNEISRNQNGIKINYEAVYYEAIDAIYRIELWIKK